MLWVPSKKSHHILLLDSSETSDVSKILASSLSSIEIIFLALLRVVPAVVFFELLTTQSDDRVPGLISGKRTANLLWMSTDPMIQSKAVMGSATDSPYIGNGRARRRLLLKRDAHHWSWCRDLTLSEAPIQLRKGVFTCCFFPARRAISSGSPFLLLMSPT